jgi:hypothetical protein
MKEIRNTPLPTSTKRPPEKKTTALGASKAEKKRAKHNRHPCGGPKKDFQELRLN